MRKLLLSFVFTAALSVVAAPSFAAGLYKCMGVNNVPVYQNEPCPAGKEIRNLSNADLISVIPPSAFTKEALKEASKPKPAEKPAPAKSEEPTSLAPSSQPFATIANKPAPAAAPVRHVSSGNVAQERQSIAAGMTRADVLARLGPPAITAGDDSDPRAQMRWVYLPTAGDSDTITTIYLNGNTVAGVERKQKN
ncbi:MAG: DUF4124 domain-containing protein [Burkholderiales bacterium]|jgi:hypothetical protein|nr:DUF4124 domain-containing protein [Burkholderiales bacterium]